MPHRSTTSSTSFSQAILNKLRKDKFRLVLTLPPILRTLNSDAARSNALVNLDALQYSVYSAPVPSINIPQQEMRFMGQAYNVTSQSRPAYPPASILFNVDNEFENYWVLWKWLEMINDPRNSGMIDHFAKFTKTTKVLDNIQNNARAVKNRLVSDQTKDANKDTVDNIKVENIRMDNDYTDYQTIITIYALDEYNKEVARFDYYNAFIISLSEIDYNFRDTEEATCTFQFAFNQLDISLLDFGTSTDTKVV